jgi:hypothetical protein
MIKRFIFYTISLFLFTTAMRMDAASQKNGSLCCCFPWLRPQRQIQLSAWAGPSLPVRQAAKAVHPRDIDPHPVTLFPAERGSLSGPESAELAAVEVQKRKLALAIKRTHSELKTLFEQDASDEQAKPVLERQVENLVEMQAFATYSGYKTEGYEAKLIEAQQTLRFMEQGDTPSLSTSFSFARVRAQRDRGGWSPSPFQLDVSPRNSGPNFRVMASRQPSAATTPSLNSQREQPLHRSKLTPRTSMQSNAPSDSSSRRQQSGEFVLSASV